MVISIRGMKRKLAIVALIALAALVLSSNPFWRLVYPFPYRDIIEKYASENRVDPFFVAAVIKAESNFNPDAESNRGARGIMQIMPETGRWAAKKMNLAGFKESMLFRPETNIRIGAWYLADLKKQFHGNEAVVAAAYNAGRGNVESWLVEEKWSGQAADLREIPYPETREFVRSVLRYKKIYAKIYGEKD